MFPWQHVTVYIDDSNMWVNNTKGMHCIIPMATVVMQTLQRYMYIASLVFLYIELCTW